VPDFSSLATVDSVPYEATTLAILSLIAISLWEHRTKKKPTGDESFRPTSILLLIPTALFVITFSVGVYVWINHGTSSQQSPSSHLDTVRTVLTASGGAVAVAGLIFTFVRQRNSERIAVRDHHHRERVADSTEDDAQQRRTADSYSKSADQLAHEETPVRLAALYSLERLAQTSGKVERQQVVNLVCAYLRRPFHTDVVELRRLRDRNLSEEDSAKLERLQVRTVAQEILSSHTKRNELSATQPDEFWEDLEIDLRSALLVDFDFSGCIVKRARFDGALFLGHAKFSKAKFGEMSNFQNSEFQGSANFLRARFYGGANFDDTLFGGPAQFSHSFFVDGSGHFHKARFRYRTEFNAVTLRGVSRTPTDADYVPEEIAEKGGIIPTSSIGVTAYWDFSDALVVAGEDHAWPVGWATDATLPPFQPGQMLKLVRVNDTQQ
jgi:uncharacterized protein YjbI with pentapeptide repeats